MMQAMMESKTPLKLATRKTRSRYEKRGGSSSTPEKSPPLPIEFASIDGRGKPRRATPYRFTLTSGVIASACLT